jgi:hypothetical protein
MIHHLSNGKYQVVSRTGRPLGTYDTEKKAKDRLQQIEMWKSINKKKKSALFELAESFLSLSSKE